MWKWEETMPDMHGKMEEVFGWVNDSQYEFIGNELIKLNKWFGKVKKYYT